MNSISQVETPDDGANMDFNFEKNSIVYPKGLDPKKLIWSLEDAQQDPLIGMTDANRHQSNMQKAI